MNKDINITYNYRDSSKLIAEFMGLKERIENDFSQYGDGYTACQYHKSWGWLMPVVEKIESLDLKEYGYKWEGIDGETMYNNGSIYVEIERNHCWIWVDLSLDPPHTINKKTYYIKYDTKIEITKDKELIENVVKKINAVYKQIKKNEIGPKVDYLMTDIRKSSLEKTIDKLQLLNKFDFGMNT